MRRAIVTSGPQRRQNASPRRRSCRSACITNVSLLAHNISFQLRAKFWKTADKHLLVDWARNLVASMRPAQLLDCLVSTPGELDGQMDPAGEEA